MKEAELARQIGTTPQAFNQRMKTGKFKYEELEQIAAALGAELIVPGKFSFFHSGYGLGHFDFRGELHTYHLSFII